MTHWKLIFYYFCKITVMIDFKFTIQTDQLALSVSESSNSQFYVRNTPGKICILCPSNTSFSEPRLQQWLYKVILEQLRNQARIILPKRLNELSSKYGFSYTKVSINSARTRWGSCSSKKSINLSLYLMLLPRHLSDYVLLHELCHTCEMNHGKSFWALMDKVTRNQAKILREELNKFRPFF